MDTVEVSTVIYLPPDDVYEFLLNFPGYARYSQYLESVTQDGDGSPGTRYDLRFVWWKLSYTARSEVTDVDPPDRIDWTLLNDIEANGHWRVEPAPQERPEDREHASRVHLVIAFDTDTASSSVLDLPRLVSLDWVIEKVTPLVQAEAKRIVERIVADIEGRPRTVDLEIRKSPDSV